MRIYLDGLGGQKTPFLVFWITGLPPGSSEGPWWDERGEQFSGSSHPATSTGISRENKPRLQEKKRTNCKQAPSAGLGGVFPSPGLSPSPAAVGRGRAASQENPEGNVSCGERLFHPNWNISGDVADFTGVVYFFIFFFRRKIMRGRRGKFS